MIDYPDTFTVNTEALNNARMLIRAYASDAARLDRGGRALRWVYFISDGNERIKIGVASNPHKRLRKLQCGSSVTLWLKGVVLGGKLLESALHEAFADQRFGGEWFACTRELREFIAEVCPQ